MSKFIKTKMKSLPYLLSFFLFISPNAEAAEPLQNDYCEACNPSTDPDCECDPFYAEELKCKCLEDPFYDSGCFNFGSGTF
jgi:hypothetical protein